MGASDGYGDAGSDPTPAARDEHGLVEKKSVTTKKSTVGRVVMVLDASDAVDVDAWSGMSGVGVSDNGAVGTDSATIACMVAPAAIRTVAVDMSNSISS